MSWLDDARDHAANVVAMLDACHERVACPKCKAPVGERCRRMPSRADAPWRPPRWRRYTGEVVAPHVERWSQVVLLT